MMDGIALRFTAGAVLLFGDCANAEFVTGNAELVPPAPLAVDLLALPHCVVLVACCLLLAFGVGG